MPHPRIVITLIVEVIPPVEDGPPGSPKRELLSHILWPVMWVKCRDLHIPAQQAMEKNSSANSQESGGK